MSIPIPLPVDTGPAPADWWMVGLTAAGIVATAMIAFLTLRANLTANRSAMIAAEADARARDANIAALQASTDAANSSAAASTQQAQLMELLVDRLNTGPGAAAVSNVPTPQPSVRWELERDRAAGRGHWLLRNRGDGIAYNAVLRGLTEQDQQDVMVVERPEVTNVSPNQYIEFRVDRTFVSPPANVVVVSWQDEFDNQQSMRFVVTS